MTSPGDDERVLEAAERTDGLSESAREAALAALAPSDRDQVELAILTNATMVEELTGLLITTLKPDAAERYAQALRTLSWRVLRIARAGAYSEVRAAIDELLAQHPELYEHAETVAVFVRTRAN